MERVEFQGALRVDQLLRVLHPGQERLAWDRRRLGSLLVDKIGVLCFGQYWPIAGWTALVILVTLLVTALAWSFRTCERCLSCGGSCCRRSHRPAGGALDPALRHLPETPVPPAYSSVALVGPGCSTPVDTEYYQRKVRGRGAGRRPHDLVLQFSNGAVRLQPDWSQRIRVDRHGLWIKPGRILGVTARSLREAIERTQQIHLCRSEDCLQKGEFHCKAYAAIDADAVIDLGAYGRLNSWRMMVLCCH